MNKLVSIIRVAIFLALSTFAFLFLFGEEQDEDLTAWMFHFLIDKTLAILAIFVIARLYRHWSKIDPWLIAYEKMCKEVEDKPNPMYFDNNKR